MSVTMRGGLVRRDSIERRTDSSILAAQHLLVRKGDLAYNTMRMWQGACGVAADDGLLSPAYVVMAPKPTIDSRFAYHWFKSSRMLYLLWAYSYGLTEDRLRLYAEDFTKIPALPPSLDLQKRIARALDCVDEEIDLYKRLSVEKQRLLRGMLSHYAKEHRQHRIEFGELASLVSDRVQPGPTTAASSIELESIETGTGRLLETQPVSEGSALRSRFRAGDTLFGKLRPYLRKSARPDHDGLCSTEIWVLRPKPRLNADLLPFLVQTQEFVAGATKQSGSKMPRADWGLVSSTPVPCPPDPAQQASAAGLLSTAHTDLILHLQRLDAAEAMKSSLAQLLLDFDHWSDRAETGA